MSRASSAESTTTPTTSRRVYACPLCPKVFSSSYALGGHQNAHRKERSDELTSYIRHRHRLHLDAIATAGSGGSSPGRFETGEPSHSNKRAKAETVSLELTLGVQGSGGTGDKSGSGPMNYNYPDVLFPASEFLDTTVDLELKL